MEKRTLGELKTHDTEIVRLSIEHLLYTRKR